MATVSCLSLNAQDAKLLPLKRTADAKILGKGKANFAFYGASDISRIPLPGFASSTFVKLPFTQDVHAHGKYIKAEDNGLEFHLEKGSYLVTFTGTFSVGALNDEVITIHGSGVFFDVALQVGSNILFINTDSHDASNNGIFAGAEIDDTGVSSISQIIKVKEHTKLSVVARCTTPDSSIEVSTRSISIVKID
jgi:hypothetical protein